MERRIYPSSLATATATSMAALAECRHVSLYIAPGGKISFIFTACVNPTDRPRPPSVRRVIQKLKLDSPGEILIENAAADSVPYYR